MIDAENPRFRINTKQTAKNYWQLDATIEYKSDKITKDAEIGKDPVFESLGLRLLSAIHEVEKEFRADGRKIVGDVVGDKE